MRESTAEALMIFAVSFLIFTSVVTLALRSGGDGQWLARSARIAPSAPVSAR
jgi:hypothetical protein